MRRDSDPAAVLPLAEQTLGAEKPQRPHQRLNGEAAPEPAIGAARLVEIRAGAIVCHAEQPKVQLATVPTVPSAGLARRWRRGSLKHLSLPPARLPMWPFDKIPNAERANEERDEAEEDHSHIKDHDASDKDHQSRQYEEDPVDDHRYR